MSEFLRPRLFRPSPWVHLILDRLPMFYIGLPPSKSVLPEIVYDRLAPIGHADMMAKAKIEIQVTTRYFWQTVANQKIAL